MGRAGVKALGGHSRATCIFVFGKPMPKCIRGYEMSNNHATFAAVVTDQVENSGARHECGQPDLRSSHSLLPSNKQIPRHTDLIEIDSSFLS